MLADDEDKREGKVARQEEEKKEIYEQNKLVPLSSLAGILLSSFINFLFS